MMYASKQAEETAGLLALACTYSRRWVIAVAAKDAGGGRLAKQFASLGVSAEELAKYHCRVVWTAAAQTLDLATDGLNMREIDMEGERWWSVPGLFGWNQVDSGSRLLLEHLPALAGTVADFGCGYGYLTRRLLQGHTGITRLDAVDIDRRAVQCAERNSNAKVQVRWQDVLQWQPEHRYDAVVMNPPFHRGSHEDRSMGQEFIRRGWAAVAPGGWLACVANRHLPYEQLLPGLTKVAERDGFKVLLARKSQ